MTPKPKTKRIKVERTRWGWHFRIWLGNSYHAAYNERFGWHIKAGRFVRARSRSAK
jgi:hypothetical protein